MGEAPRHRVKGYPETGRVPLRTSAPLPLCGAFAQDSEQSEEAQTRKVALHRSGLETRLQSPEP